MVLSLFSTDTVADTVFLCISLVAAIVAVVPLPETSASLDFQEYPVISDSDSASTVQEIVSPAVTEFFAALHDFMVMGIP